mgnify:CR=1 FL=1
MKNYVIIDASEVPSVDFNQVLESSEKTLRFSVDGSKTFVNFADSAPAFLAGKPEISHAEILEILSGSEWTIPEEEI